jgi:acyl-CoA synthetase (AMP-forming)/AMP-acid ligase II
MKRHCGQDLLVFAIFGQTESISCHRFWPDKRADSGDSCAYDEDGLRIMLDRYKDIIKSGDKNVSSLRVEAVLSQHPDVETAVVIGLPHPRWGEAVTAVVVRMPGSDPDPQQIIDFCRLALAGYETPKDIIFAEALPQTVGGKVLKYKLRARHSEHFDGTSASSRRDRTPVGRYAYGSRGGRQLCSVT